MVLDEVAAYMETQGIGTRAVDLFEGDLPISPDACVAVIEYPGVGPDYTLGTGVSYEYPRIQVLVRNPIRATAESKANAAFKALAAVVNQSLSGVSYLAITPLQSPFLLEREKDALQRWKLAFNCQVLKAVS